MSIARFQRILKGVVCPMLAVMWIAKLAILQQPIDPSVIIVIGGLLGIRFVGNGTEAS